MGGDMLSFAFSLKAITTDFNDRLPLPKSNPNMSWLAQKADQFQLW
jgi:hypothetical protein